MTGTRAGAKRSSTKDAGSSAGDWREKTLARVRALIQDAAPGVVEDRKWKKASNKMAGVPVWSHPACGMICTGETYKGYVKVTFAKGASLPDPKSVFNASLEGGTRRAIDIREGDTLNAAAFKALVKSAVKAGAGAKKQSAPKDAPAKVRMLAGGNPKMAKADGDAAVQKYIAAMPGWKRDVGKRLDAIVTKAIPPTAGLMKAVKWNSPFYGTPRNGWFLSFHCFTRYVKVAFFNGQNLRPMPPVASTKDITRYLHVHEGDTIDEAQVAKWVKQGVKVEGWKMG